MGQVDVCRSRVVRRICGLVAACVAVSGVAGADVALADPVPLWSDPITTTSWEADGVAGREALLTNPSQKGYLDTVDVINSDGTTEYQTEIEGQTVPPALATDGSGYVLHGGGGDEVINAITTTGTVRWSYPVPGGEIVRSLLAGDDGAAYVGLSGSSGEEILRLEPTNGSVAFATKLPATDGAPISLFGEPQGVAVGTNGDSTLNAAHVLFLSEQGTIVHDVNVAPADEPDFYSSNDAGEVFAAYAPLKNGWIDTTKGLTIAKVTTGGKVAWRKRTPHNRGSISPPIVAALPSGGVAFDLPSGSLGVLNANGSIAWSTETEGYPMVVDASGHLDLITLVNHAICSDGYDNCDGFRIDQLQAANGAVQNSVSVVGSSDPSRSGFNGGFAAGPERVYLLCSGALGDDSCGDEATQPPQLQAYALPETAGPYPVPPATIEATGHEESASYVALGDSYSSGEGNPPYEAGTDTAGETPDRCHRSAAAYAPLLDSALGLGSMIFKACSGAVTDDIFESNDANLAEPAQRSWLHAGTKTVTLTIGGNDAGFAWVLKHCVSFPPFIRQFSCSTKKQLEQETQARLTALAGGSYATTPPPLSQPIHSILSVIQAIHASARSAHIYVGLYPLLFGESIARYSEPLAAPGTLACEVGFNLWVSYKDAVWLNKRGEQLNKIITKAIKKAEHEGIAASYTEPSAFSGHGFCDVHEPWFYPLVVEGEIRTVPELEAEVVDKPGSFHPTEVGQRLGYEAAFAAQVK